MKRFIIILLILPMTIVLSYADKVYLHNGDVISGTIGSLEDDVLTLQTSFMGELSIQWESVSGLQTEKLVSVTLQNGDRITAVFDSNKEHPFLLQSSLFSDTPLPKRRIHAIGVESNIRLQKNLEAANETINDLSTTLHTSNQNMAQLESDLDNATSVSKLWNGSVGLLGGLKTGNRQSFDLFVKAEAVRKTDSEKLTLRSDFGYGETENVVETTEGRFQSNIQVDYADNAYVFGDLLLEHDRFEDLNLRVDGTVGSGYRFWITDESELAMDIGIGLSQEIFKSGGDASEGILRFNGEYSVIIFDKTKFTQVLTVFPSLGRFGEMRLISRSTFETPILNSLTWDLSIIDEFDTDPRNATIDKNDLAVRTGLSYSF